jgi:hypothetical protein
MMISTALTYALATALHQTQAYWAVLTASIVTQTSVGGSLKAAIDRLVGSICGALVGALAAVLLPAHTPITLGLVLVGAITPLVLLTAYDMDSVGSVSAIPHRGRSRVARHIADFSQTEIFSISPGVSSSLEEAMNEQKAGWAVDLDRNWTFKDARILPDGERFILNVSSVNHGLFWRQWLLKRLLI